MKSFWQHLIPSNTFQQVFEVNMKSQMPHRFQMDQKCKKPEL